MQPSFPVSFLFHSILAGTRVTSQEGTILAMEDYLAAFDLARVTMVNYCVAFGFKNTCKDGMGTFKLPKESTRVKNRD